MASNDPKRSKQCAAGKKKHLTLMILQKPEIGGLKVATDAVCL